MRQLLNKLKSQKFHVWGIPTIPLLYILLFFIVWLVFLALTNWINQDKWGTLVHEQYGFTIDYPTNWRQFTFGDEGHKNWPDLKVILNEHSIFSTKTLRIYWLPLNNPTSEQLSMWGLEKIKISNDNFLPSELEDVHIGKESYPALKQTFQIDKDFTKYVLYYIVDDDGAFLLQFYITSETQDSEAKPIFDRMLSSFHILD